MNYLRLKDSILPFNARFMMDNDIPNPGLQEAYFKGDILTTTDWIVVTHSGWFYDTNALYTTWYMENGEMKKVLNYTKNALHQTILALKRGLPIPIDIETLKPMKPVVINEIVTVTPKSPEFIPEPTVDLSQIEISEELKKDIKKPSKKPLKKVA